MHLLKKSNFRVLLFIKKSVISIILLFLLIFFISFSQVLLVIFLFVILNQYLVLYI